MDELGPPPCPRCYTQLELVRPWRGFRVVRVLWIVGTVVLLALGPIVASDITVMLPLSMAYLSAGGPVFAFAQATPSCRACGLSRPSPGWHETPCRPVHLLHALDDASPHLRVRPTRDDAPTEDSGVRELPTAPVR